MSHPDEHLEFLRAFEACTLPKSEWTHAAHLRMAWLYLRERPFADALLRVRDGIQRYNSVQGNGIGYHETVTRGFLRLVEHRRRAGGASREDWQAFQAANPELFARGTSPLLRHYQEATLKSEAARDGWVEPDREPFPEVAWLREAEEKDAGGLAEIYSHYIVSTAATFETEPVDAREMARRLRELTRTHPWLVCERGGELLGYAYAGRHHERAAYRWSVNTSVYVRADRHRGGVGRALYASLLACLRLQGFHGAFGGITLPNPASVGLHEAFGFQLAGTYRAPGFKLGAWHDVSWWQRRLGEEAAGAPPEPRTPEECRARPEWREGVGSGTGFLRV